MIHTDRTSPAYAELQVTSNFSFLHGASHPEEMVERASELGYRALALTDRNTLAGVVRGYEAAGARVFISSPAPGSTSATARASSASPPPGAVTAPSPA